MFFNLLDTIVIEVQSIRKRGYIREILLLISVTEDLNDNTVLMQTKYPCKISYKILDIVKGTRPFYPVSNATIWLGANNTVTLYGSLKQGKYYIQGSYLI